MRITNTMMTNTTMRNVNKSKTNLYTTEQQMASQKKISKPSDDPIIAIRALSLRTSLAEVEQYLKKNVPDAKAWIKLTETSLDNMDGIYTDLVKLCTQGENDTFETTNRQAIIQSDSCSTVRACLKKTSGEVIFHPCRCLFSISSILFLHPQTGDPA